MSTKDYQPATNVLLDPWTPVEVTQDDTGVTVGVWGRTHRFESHPLPTSIVAAGQELLKEPMRVTGQSRGKPIEWSDEGVQLIVHTHTESEAIILGCARSKCGELILNTCCHIEYDGCMFVDIKLMPGNGPSDEEAVLLDKLAVEVPFRPAAASLFHYWPQVHMGTGPNISAENAGAIPNNGLELEFKPFLWLGNEEAGLCWFAENDRHWQPEEGKALEVTREDETILLTVHLLDSLYEPWRDNAPTWRHRVGPLVYRMGIQATPVKPIDPAYFDRRIGFHHGHCIADTKAEGTDQTVLERMIDMGVNIIACHEQWQPVQNYGFSDKPENVKRNIQAAHDRGVKCLAYFGYELASLAPEWGEHADNWLVRNLDYVPAGGWRRQPHQRDYIVCSNSGWQDTLLKNMQHAVETLGFDGVYLDQTNVAFGCACEEHGCGWRDENGKLHIHFPIRSARNLMKRIHEFLHPRGGLIDLHQSSGCVMPTMSFADSYFDTEHLIWLKKYAEDPYNAVGLETMRASFMGWNWGVPAEYMACSSSWAFTLTHGIINRPIDRTPDDSDKLLWGALREFGWGQAEFLGYWKNGHMLQVNHHMLRASTFLRTDIDGEVRAMLIVGNLTGTNQEANAIDAKLTMDFDALGVDANSVTLERVVSGEGAVLAGNVISCTLAPMGTGVFIVHAKAK
jgi:hypothetical protein